MEKHRPIYLDHAATTPMLPEAYESMLPFFKEEFGNASSSHIYGQRALEAVEKAQEQVAHLLNCQQSEVIWTSGSTESINTILKGLYFQYSSEKNHIITVKTEHKAVLNCCNWLESIGAKVTYLNVDKNGLIDYKELEHSINPRTLVVSVMMINNETGVIHDVNRISDICQKHGTFFFSDTTQAVGKIPINLEKTRIDYCCFSGHKMGGPKGVGGLYMRNKSLITPLIHGGNQQKGFRSGTFNVPGIVGLGASFAIHSRNILNSLVSARIWQDKFEKTLFNEGLIQQINCSSALRSPYITSVILKREEADKFLLRNQTNFTASDGSACSSGIQKHSHVIEAIGQSSVNLSKTVRFSFNNEGLLPINFFSENRSI